MSGRRRGPVSQNLQSLAKGTGRASDVAQARAVTSMVVSSLEGEVIVPYGDHGLSATNEEGGAGAGRGGSRRLMVSRNRNRIGGLCAAPTRGAFREGGSASVLVTRLARSLCHRRLDRASTKITEIPVRPACLPSHPRLEHRQPPAGDCGFLAPWRGGRVVDCTALEMRHGCKPIGGSNPPLSANLMN